jgi:hypothetical protein
MEDGARAHGQNGWIWYGTASAKPGATALAYRGVVPTFDFEDEDPLGCAPTTVRAPRAEAPGGHAVVRLPPAIPANGPASAAPAGPAMDPSDRRSTVIASPGRRRRSASGSRPMRSSPDAAPTVDPSAPLLDPLALRAEAPAQVRHPRSFHWVQRDKLAPRRPTFEFSGTAAKLTEGKSIIIDGLDFELPPPPKETVLRMSDGSLFFLTFAVVLGAFMLAFALSSEITVGVHALVRNVSTMVAGLAHG